VTVRSRSTVMVSFLRFGERTRLEPRVLVH
jgi:hypothetical protein